MKAIILCAGYATRLYPFTINEPKALLQVNGFPLLSYTIKNLQEIKEIDKIYIVTNNKFYENFKSWKKEQDSRVELINNETNTNEERLGGVVDLNLALQKFKEDDFLIILGDNFFNFQLKKFVGFFKQKKAICIALHDIKDIEKAKRFGVVSVDKKNRVLNFEEKPSEPKSTLISTGAYIFTKKDLEDIRKYIELGKPKEGPGYIIKDFLV